MSAAPVLNDHSKSARPKVKGKLRLTAIGFLLAVQALANPAQVDEPVQTSAAIMMDVISARAEKLAQGKFEPLEEVDQALANMSYQQYRAINFKAEHALWRGDALFELQFFHPGFLYRHPVMLREVSSSGINKKIDFAAEHFDYREGADVAQKHLQGNPGYSGFRVHFPLNDAHHKDEVLVFQGASYFRLVGPGQVYGVSARGLAVDTAESSGEEFPYFRDFWLVKPSDNASEMVFYALLDSPSVAGAYRFTLTPNVTTEMKVEARLYPRVDIKKLGIAPLTSMFHHGENTTRFIDDFRPEVHDSDGLLMQTSQGEWIWRPLTNPRSLRVVSLTDENPRGFGLLQRDREFSHYLDTEAKYGMRPSVWVEPIGEWGRGRVELVEIPTHTETNDNIAAYWVPEQKIEAGKEYRYQYTMRTFGSSLAAQNKAQVIRTRIGWVNLPGQNNASPRQHRQFIVDFAGGELAGVSTSMDLQANLNLSSGEAVDLDVLPLPEEGHWRVTFKLLPKGNEPVDLRLFITLRDYPLTEVWNYVWSADAVGE